jgi:hypothetical protein
MLRKLIDFVTWPWTYYQERKRIKKRLQELKDKDPFIYE